VNSDYIITREDQLSTIFGEPSDLVKQKIGDSLNESMRTFIGRSPLVFYSTVDSRGLIDVSPKGDAPGFVHIEEDGNLLIPDRPGNKLTYGYRNLLSNPSIGLIFVVPSMRETLRVKGRAVISNDPVWLDLLSAQGKPATLCVHVQVEECFFHCGKAMIRSKLWKPERWTEYKDSLLAQGLASKIDSAQITEEIIQEHLEHSYEENLY
jgi:PPOX class probable FMN-dependent enzyme